MQSPIASATSSADRCELSDDEEDEVRAGDIAILARSNWFVDQMTERVREALTSHGVDVRADRGMTFYARPEVVATYRILRLLIRYPDDSALSSALRTPYFDELPDLQREERRLLQYGTREGQPLTDWFEEVHVDQVEQLADLRRAARTDTAPQLLGRLYETFGVRERYAGDAAALAGLERLRERARDLFDKEQALTLRIFTDWLGDAVLRGYDVLDPAQGREDEQHRPPYVRVMTIHRAKGLEFPNRHHSGPRTVADPPGLGARVPLRRGRPRPRTWATSVARRGGPIAWPPNGTPDSTRSSGSSTSP